MYTNPEVRKNLTSQVNSCKKKLIFKHFLPYNF